MVIKLKMIIKLKHNNNKDKNWICIGTYSADSNQIKSFNIKNAFRALDYNDSEYIGHQAMPSGRYIDLTLGSSGASYTAPADGWFVVDRRSGAAGEYLVMNNTSIGNLFFGAASVASSGMECGRAMPARKGDVVKIDYPVLENNIWEQEKHSLAMFFI